MQAFLTGVSVGANHSSHRNSSWIVMLAAVVLGVCGVALSALAADSLMTGYMPPPT